VATTNIPPEVMQNFADQTRAVLEQTARALGLRPLGEPISYLTQSPVKRAWTVVIQFDVEPRA
jgi:hypothetical protein